MTFKNQLQIPLRIVPKTQMYDICKMEGGLMNINTDMTNHIHLCRLTNSVSYVYESCSTLHLPKQRGAGTKYRTCQLWFSPASGLSWSSYRCRICIVVTGCTSHCRIPRWTPPRSSTKGKMCALIVSFC